MTLARGWVLIFLLVPIAWAIWQWLRFPLDRKQRWSLLLKCLSLVAIVLALAEPTIPVEETKSAVAVLVDTSASVADADLERASKLAGRFTAARGRNWMQVIPFARQSRAVQSPERASGWKLQRTEGDGGRGTDLEAAIRQATAQLPERAVPRVALLTDGRETHGSVVRAAWQAKELGIPVDVFPLNGRTRPALRIDEVSAPTFAFTGERFPIELAVSSPRATSAELEIRAEGKVLGSTPLTLQAGENRVLAQATLSVAGALAVGGVLRAPGLGEVPFMRAITLRKPKVLYVSQDPEGTEANLLRTMQAAEMEVRRSSSIDDANLRTAQLLVLNNQDLENLPLDRKSAVESFVRQGGGLVVIGGERNVFVEKKPGTPEDALERTLPAKLAPPKSPEGTCVVLIIDKSSSMEGKKMELARQAAIGVIENLRPNDLVGVLIFDNSFQWAVPIRKAEDRTLIKRLVGGITPDGGTQIAPALSEAFRRTIPVRATFKHIVLLTDGISEEGDSVAVAREAQQQKITISTVGLGQDVNRAYLERIATLSKGKAYFLNDPSSLEQILLRDVMEFTGSTAIEKSITPLVLKQVEILSGIDIAKSPALKGYVKFATKPTAETILAVPGQTPDQQDPLLARWQYGLGRAAVFTSDAKSRWAEAWMTWPGFDRFWENLLRDLLPHADLGEARVDFEAGTSELTVDYRLGPDTPEPATVPAVFAIGPDGFQQPVNVQKLAPGAYRGRVTIGDRQGLFRIRPLVESKAFPETGYYRQEREFTDYGANEPLLRQIAAYTGGSYNPDPARIFDSNGRRVLSTVQLWPGLLAAAILLNLAELILRKWSALMQARGA